MTETRTEETQRIPDKPRVTMTKHGNFLDDAQVHCGQHTYTVMLYSNAPYYCTCGWGLFRKVLVDPCIHAAAVMLAIGKSYL